MGAHRGLGHSSDKRKAEVTGEWCMLVGLLSLALRPLGGDPGAAVLLLRRTGPFSGLFNTRLLSFQYVVL